MKKQDNYVSEETAMALLQAGIIEKEQPVPTLTECIVYFAEMGVYITSSMIAAAKWHTVVRTYKDPKKWVRRYNQSYIEAMNAAIRDAAVAYTRLKKE